MTTIKVNGMSCAHCQKAVTDALTELGLRDVSVNLEGGTASYTSDAAVTQDAIKDAIEEAGFEAEF